MRFTTCRWHVDVLPWRRTRSTVDCRSACTVDVLLLPIRVDNEPFPEVQTLAIRFSMALQLPRQADFSANIFRRGQKRELFEDAEEEEVSAETELASKLGDLATLWAADRIG